MIDGTDITTLKGEAKRQMRRNIQMVFQDPGDAFYPRMKVKDIICEPLLNFKVIKKSQVHEKAAELLAQVGLEAGFADKYPHSMSGGQRQRVGIARSLALNPKLIILDEATSALDVCVQQQVIELLRTLQKEKQITMLFICHDIGLVRHLADRVCVMQNAIVVGRGLGYLEFAAVSGSASKLIVLVTNFFLGVSVGITVYASRYFGKKDFRTLKGVIANGLVLFGVMELVLSGLCIVFSMSYLEMMGTLKGTEPYSFHLDGVLLKEVAAMGIPSGVQSMMFSLSNMAVQSAVNGFSAITVAGWGAYLKIDSIADVFLTSLSSAVTPFIGQNLGAGKIDRMKEAMRQIMIISYIMMAVVTAVFLLFRVPLLALFTTESEVVAIGTQVMWVILPMYLLGIPQRMYSTAIRGFGKSMGPMWLSLIGVVGLRFVWVYVILPLNPTILMLGLCYPVCSLLMSVVFTVYYKKELRIVEASTSNHIK